MAKLFLSYLPCNIFKCLRLDSFCKSCRRQDTFFHFSITNPFRAKCLLNTCAIKPPVHFLSTTDLLPIKTLWNVNWWFFFFRHNWFPCLLLVRAKDLQCGQSRLDEDKFARESNPANHQYLFPVFPPPAISFFLLWSQDFSHFSSWISLGHNKAFPEEQYSCSPKLACDSEVKKEERGVLRLCLVPTLIAISSYEWVGYYRFYVLFICFCLSLHYIRRTV